MIHRPTIYSSSLESKGFKQIILRMLALKLLKKCSENSSKERGKGNSAYAYLHSRMHNAYAALYRGVEYFHRLHVTVRTGGEKKNTMKLQIFLLLFKLFKHWSGNN